MTEEVAVISHQLAQAVELMMNPAIPQVQRQQAYQQLEEFKEKSPFGSQCGFFLFTSNQSQVVRHFGLKILEDVVKARWNDMVGEEKVFIKENLMKLVASGTNSIMQEHNHIKDGLAKIVVELIKREWPQQWPSLLGELESLCRLGETPTELVMFILLRLIEDVAVLQTLEQSQRRKEIYTALTSNMEEIFRFLLELLEMHYKSYLEKKGTPAGAQHCKVCQAILNTFTSLVEWVPIQHIMANNKYLLHCLTHLLSDENLQNFAAECLLGVVSWRAGKMTERAQLLCLFEMDFMGQLFAATEAAEQHALEENHYNFLKRMVQIITGLGDQLCALTTKETPRPVPNLHIYLNALIAFTRHPSQTVNLMANDLWGRFFRHPDIAADPVLKSFQVTWMETAMKKAVKVGSPEAAVSSHPSCPYSALDFDDEDEFNGFFGKYRLCILECVRAYVQVPGDRVAAIRVPLTILDQWLRQVLASSQEPQLELEAIAVLLDSVFSKITSVDQLRGGNTVDGNNTQTESIETTAANLLQLCLEYSPPANNNNSPLPQGNPRVISELLSCISALFVVVLAVPGALQPILNKIFSTLVTGPPPGTPLSKDLRTLRRHSCSLFIKLSTRFPQIMLTAFDFLRTEIIGLNSRQLISRMEYVSLLESLILISNQLAQYDRQVEFIKSISESFIQQFLALQPHYSSPESLLQFIGLDRAPVVIDNKSTTFNTLSDEHGQNRSQLSMVNGFLLALARRAEGPSDTELLSGGGFQIQLAGKSVTRNPAGSLLCSVLQNILMLGQNLNLMFGPGLRSKVHPAFLKALDLLDVDKNNILGLPGSRTAKNEMTYELKTPEPVTKMQNFVTELFENVQHLLSYFCTNIGYEFYQQPRLAEMLCLTTLANLQGLPDFRLRAINRMFLKSFINKCPIEFLEPVLLPILKQIVPYMLNRMQERWSYLRKLRENPSFDEDNTDSQEVLDDVIIRVTAREYLDTVKALLTSGGGLDTGKTDDKESSGLSLSVLGELALADPVLSEAVTLTCLKALNWPDSLVGTRAAMLVELILPKMCSSSNFGPEAASSVMFEVLSAFPEMGMHDMNNVALTHLALNCYVTLRPAYPNIINVMAQVPGCNHEDLQKFDAKIMMTQPGIATGEKAKKDMFKKLISQLVGKETAKMFKKEIVIKNLPNLQPLKVKPKTPSLDEQTDRNGQETGLAALFGQ